MGPLWSPICRGSCCPCSTFWYTAPHPPIVIPYSPHLSVPSGHYHVWALFLHPPPPLVGWWILRPLRPQLPSQIFPPPRLLSPDHPLSSISLTLVVLFVLVSSYRWLLQTMEVLPFVFFPCQHAATPYNFSQHYDTSGDPPK